MSKPDLSEVFGLPEDFKITFQILIYGKPYDVTFALEEFDMVEENLKVSAQLKKVVPE